MTVINTNTASINAQFNLNKVNKEMEKAMEQLSSGKRINSAADDAAGLSIATRMESQVRGLQQAISNAADGQNLAATAEGAMDEITNMLQRMRELALQASNDTMNSQDRENLDQEMGLLKQEIDRIVDTTAYNNIKLLDGSNSSTLQIGQNKGEELTFTIADMSTTSLGSSTSSIAVNASTSAVGQGVEASENVVNLTFNGNDSYGFKILFDATAAKEITIAPTAMVAGDAATIAKAINDQIAADADVKGTAVAKASGTTVTLTSLDGSSIKVHDFTSAAAGTLTVNPVTDSSAASKTLEDVTESAALTNSGGTAATASTASLMVEHAKAYSFKINGTEVQVGTGDTDQAAGNAIAAKIKSAIEATSSGTATVTATINAGKYTFDMADDSGARIDMTAFQKLTTTAVPNGAITFQNVKGAASGATITVAHGGAPTSDGTSSGTLLVLEDTKTAKLGFSNSDLSYGLELGGASYTIDGKTKDFQDELTRVAQEITSANTGVTAANVNGILEISNASGANVALFDSTGDTISALGITAVDAGAAYFLADAGTGDISGVAGVATLDDGSTGQSTDGVPAVASQMFLKFNADDRYTFTIDGDGVGAGAVTAEIVADLNGGNLSGLVNSINAQSTTTSITAAEQDGQIVLTKADGTTFSVTGFSSEGTGSITAVNAGGQGSSTLLENAGDGDEFLAAESQKATATTMQLTFSTADKFSFKITDGDSTATVRATSTTMADGSGVSNIAVDHDNEVAEIEAEIGRALQAANMDHISVSSTNGVLTLTNALGSKLEIADFKSDGTGTITATPGSKQGVGKILDDTAASGSMNTVSSVSATTSTVAKSAIDTIDRALENINQARAGLGAISNRLDHTIANLGNVIINTEASQSRIEDADFAKVTGELTKSQIMSQAATAMLAQANASKQGVLSLLQG